MRTTWTLSDLDIVRVRVMQTTGTLSDLDIVRVWGDADIDHVTPPPLHTENFQLWQCPLSTLPPPCRQCSTQTFSDWGIGGLGQVLSCRCMLPAADSLLESLVFGISGKTPCPIPSYPIPHGWIVLTEWTFGLRSYEGAEYSISNTIYYSQCVWHLRQDILPCPIPPPQYTEMVISQLLIKVESWCLVHMKGLWKHFQDVAIWLLWWHFPGNYKCKRVKTSKRWLFYLTAKTKWRGILHPQLPQALLLLFLVATEKLKFVGGFSGKVWVLLSQPEVNTFLFFCKKHCTFLLATERCINVSNSLTEDW